MNSYIVGLMDKEEVFAMAEALGIEVTWFEGRDQKYLSFEEVCEQVSRALNQD
jgi:hypothetical protein